MLVLSAGGCPQTNRDQDCYQLKWPVLPSLPSLHHLTQRQMHLQPHLDHLHNTFFSPRLTLHPSSLNLAHSVLRSGSSEDKLRAA